MPTDRFREPETEFKSGVAPSRARNFIRQGSFAIALTVFAVSASAATLGTVVPIPGHMSDIAVDAGRGVLYAANFTANRIEVVSLATHSLQTPIIVAAQPSSVALSPDGQYLVVGHYANTTNPNAAPGLTILNLNLRTQKTLSLDSVLAVEFAGTCPLEIGDGPAALVVHNTGVSLLCPATGAITTLTAAASSSKPLPVPWASFPATVIQASAGVSGDGNVVYAVVATGTANPTIIRYDSTAPYKTDYTGSGAGSFKAGALGLTTVTAVPNLGPTVISVDKTGSTLLAGWALIDANVVELAQFPSVSGALSVGGHAFDWSRNLIYAQVPVNTTPSATASASTPPVLQVLDSDNLTVREVFQLRENLAGKALLSGDNMYAISDSGLTILPMGALAGLHRVKAAQEDLLFPASACSQGIVTQFLDIVDPNGGATAFTLSVNSPGVKLSATSGTTPARVQVAVDPTVFQSQKGTATVWLQLASTQAVNVASPVRLLINTRDPDQQGALYDVPGTIVDVLADPARNQFYVIRQDQNEVLVFDGTTFAQVAALRTGNTPVQMALFNDYLNGAWLLVTNDNSQIISVFDLNTLKAANPIPLPPGLYGRSIAVSNYSKILVTTRKGTAATGPVVGIDLAFGFSNEATVGIYTNDVDANSGLVASPSGRMIFNPRPDGTVALYDAQADAFISSRKDLQALSGAYSALSDSIFMAGNQVFNSAMVSMGQLDVQGGVSSGSTVVEGAGLLSSAPSGGRNGVLQRFSMDQFNAISPMRVAEAPNVSATLTAAPIGEDGQAGRAILSFTRTLAPLANRQSIVLLSTSGFTVLPWNFDAATQPPVISAVTNAADPASAIAPGSLVSIWGSSLSSANSAASAVPLPRLLGGVCVYANGTPLPLLYVSPGQINAQVPFNLPPSAGLVISNAGGQNAPFNFTSDSTGPAVFHTGNGGAVIVRTVDGKLITDSTPIHLDEILNIYMTGMGVVSPNVNPGDAAPTSPLAATIAQPSITLGGASIFTLWSGLAPGMVGVYQINAQVPFHHIPTGSKVPLTITQGSRSTTVMVPVQE
jgi:uncharacterized protein (TIGR03437 family)